MAVVETERVKSSPKGMAYKGAGLPALPGLSAGSIDILREACKVLHYGNQDGALIRRVGASLCAAGGFRLMQTTFYAFAHIFPDAGESHWILLRANDQYVVQHNFCLVALSPATAYVVRFDPDEGADAVRQYATKYVAKPEPYSFLETEAGAEEGNPTKRCRRGGG